MTHAAITGASSGIGEALALELSRAGYKLTLVARRRDLLDKLAAETGATPFVACHDLAKPESCTEWVAGAEAANGPIDVLVNNAGVQIIGPSHEVDLDRVESMLRLNLLTPLRLTRAVLPGMIARGRGTIVDVASMAAIAPTPWMAYYNASKAGFAAFSESLRPELVGKGVHVVTVYPGPVTTAMGDKGFAAYEPSFSSRTMPVGNAPELARLVRRAIEKKKDRVIYPWSYTVSRWFPGTTRFVLDRFTPRPKSGGGGTGL